MNMENEKKQNVETVQSTGDKENLRAAESVFRDNIIFKCSYPNSSEYVDFRVEPKQSLNRHFYDLIYDSDYIVHKHNLEKNHVLTHKKYENTLQQWLDNNDNNWCEIYKGWDVNRPKEDARKIIQGILNAVYKLHKNGSFHGFLHHPENFAMDSDELVIGGDHKEIKHISLIHSNVGCNQSSSKDFDLQMGMKNDIQAMSQVIFDQILGGNTPYPPDLCDLYSKLQKLQNDGDSVDWELIVNHPSLWHWKSRFSYIGRVWTYYRHATETTKKIMETELSNFEVSDWVDSLLSDSVLSSIYNFPRPKSYQSNARELFRYLRNARFHYRDYKKGKEGTYQHITDPTKQVHYLDEKFIELKTTGIAERFLVNLHAMMHRLDLHFKI